MIMLTEDMSEFDIVSSVWSRNKDRQTGSLLLVLLLLLWLKYEGVFTCIELWLHVQNSDSNGLYRGMNRF